MIQRNITVECTHCGLPVPAGLIKPGCDDQYCCHGCSAAYKLIHSAGLDAFYRMVDSPAENQSLRKRTTPESKFMSFDDVTFLSRFARGLPAGLLEINLALDGIHCAACVWLVEKLPSILTGVTTAQLNWSAGTVKLRWQPEQVHLSKIAETLYRLGYAPHPLRPNEKSDRRLQENRKHLVRIGIAAAAAGNNMIIAAALYLGLFSSMETEFVTLLRWASCVVGVASLLGPGRIFLRGAMSALQTGTPHMDLPIALGLGTGTLAGLFNTIRGAGEIYFDSLSVLIFLLLIGRWIQFRQQNRAADAIEMLYRLTPQRARKIVNGIVMEVVVEDVATGDLLEIRPGDLVPADAEIVEGRSDVDESILSGESRPAQKRVGDVISAGTKNVSSSLVARVTAIGEETRISKIVELVEQVSIDKPELVQWANRIGGYFVVTIIVLAVITFGVWLYIEPSLATDRAVALLIVACPCALALATPLAIAVALGRMANQKIMIKSGDVMQALDRPGLIWLDKTGTLTEGRMQVVEWSGDRRWLPVIAAAEMKFTHPIAVALTEYGPEIVSQHALPASQGFEVSHSLALSNGISAEVDGKAILIGNRQLLESAGILNGAQPEANVDELKWRELEQRALDCQLSPCWVAIDGAVVGMFGLGDRIRDDAASTLESLRRRGWQIGILSGDHPVIVNEVARQLQIDKVRASVTPEEKLVVIRESNQQFSTTVMVGDGVNDCAALAAATVGIAVHNGAEASLAAAPVYFGESGLAPLEALFAASRSTCTTIRRNFAASLGYNAIGAGLAMTGLIHPLVAAILMPLSSLTVIAISLRAGHVKND